MGEERGGGLEKKPLNASREASLAHTTIQSAAEPITQGLSAPKLPVAIPPVPTPSSIPKPSAMAIKDAIPDEKKAKWNTNKLGLRVGVDALAGLAAGGSVAPVIAMIDRAIMENASGRNTLGESLKNSAKELLLRPHHYLAARPFRLIVFVYSSTYFTANCIDTTSSTMNNTPLTSTTAGTSKFLATSTTNTALGLYKDKCLAQMFGSSTSARPVPVPSFALFTIRDCLTIFASFNLPPLLGPRIEKSMSEEVKKYVSGASTAQFITPAAFQFITTPFHLLGLDLYNRPGVAFAGQDGRAAKVIQNWVKSAFARIGRIVPAFGFGGVINMKVRKNLMGKLEEH